MIVQFTQAVLAMLFVKTGIMHAEKLISNEDETGKISDFDVELA